MVIDMKLYSKRVSTSAGCKAGTLEFEGGHITAFYEDEHLRDAIDYGGMRIIPGIFDTHNHGTCGFDLTCSSDKEEDREKTVRGYLKGLASQGTVNVFPTPMGVAAISTVAKVAREGVKCGANVLGIHSEGPWLSRVGEKGVRTPWPEISVSRAKELVDAGSGMLKLMAIAPEIPGAEEVITYLLSEGIVVAAAHSDNTFKDARAAYKAGISVSTHTGNVMTGMHHRDIGGLGAALTNSDVMCEVICDGMHICNEMLDIFFRIKDYSHFMLVSDCTAFSGAPAGVYRSHMGGGIDRLNVTKEGFVLSETGRLCGSSQPVLYGIGNLVENVGVPLDVCLEMACLNPAKKYGFDKTKGSIEPGKDADLVVISDDWRAQVTYARGKKVFDRSIDGSIFNEEFFGELLIE